MTARAFVAIVLAAVMTGATARAPTAATYPDPSVSAVQTAVPIGAVPCPLGAPADRGCLAASACCVTTPLPAQVSPAPWSAAADAMIYPVVGAFAAAAKSHPRATPSQSVGRCSVSGRRTGGHCRPDRRHESNLPGPLTSGPSRTDTQPDSKEMSE